MIKTLHLTNAYHDASGGIRTFYRALLAGAGRRGRHVRLIVPGAHSWTEEVNPWARVFHVAAPPSPFVDRRYRLLLPHRYLFGRTGPIWALLHRERPDLVEVCDKYTLVYLGGLIRRRWIPHARRPAMAALSCERMDDNVATFLSGGTIARRFSRWYMRRVYTPQFDAHIAVSTYTAGELSAGTRPIAVAPMGLETAVFAAARRDPAARAAILEAVGLAPDAVLLLYVGRLSREKGLPLLVDVLRAVLAGGERRAHLLVAGDGPLREWLMDRARALGANRVRLLGHLGRREDLARCYANADLLLHPNAREPYGLVPLEAMASGLPVVLPRSGGVLEYARDDNAWLAEPAPEAMAHAVLSALSQPEERARRAARARQVARELDWVRVTDRYFDLYDRIVAHSEATRPVTQPRRWLPEPRLRDDSAFSPMPDERRARTAR